MPEAEFMDPKRFEALKVTVEGACGISMTTTHIDPRYSLQSCPEVDATKSAHILVFSLISNAPGLPLFRGRWDERASAVDVDLKGSNPDEGQYPDSRLSHTLAQDVNGLSYF